MHMGQTPQYGTYELGRLKYRTAEEARGAARDLGLSGTHSHTMDGERVFMPGKNHTKLNEALEKQGLAPTPVPGEGGGGGMMGGMMDPSKSSIPDVPEPDMPDPEPLTDEQEISPGELFGPSPMGGDEDDDGDMELY
jgi:hypothetical protein